MIAAPVPIDIADATDARIRAVREHRIAGAGSSTLDVDPVSMRAS